MPELTVLSATLQCTMGTAPATFVVTPKNKCLAGSMPAANITDFAPIANVTTFAMCTTQSNPAVAAATSAAMGTPTPAPCIPATASPWTPGSSKVLLNGQPALNSSSTCTCSYGGTISIKSAGQTKVQIA